MSAKMDDIRKQIIYKPLDELKPYKRNPRKNDGAVDAVAASIKEFGFKVPIVIDTNGEIVAGHTRLKAAKKLGLAEVPCIIADDLTPEQIKAFRLADNKTAELAEWDFDLLHFELDDIDLDMSDFGFTPPENVSETYTAHASLKEQFIVPPFSVLDARSGDWQKRKRKWLEIIKSGEGRDDDGIYRNFIGDTVEAVKRAGAAYYNEIVLVTMLGTLPIRIRRQFEASRKVGNTHQKALIFLKSKGDEKALKDYLESFSETRIITPMKKSILVFLKGRAVKKKDVDRYEFDMT